MSAPFDWLSGWDKEPLTDKPVRVIGIDLGTTNSTVTDIVWSPASGEQPVATLIDIPQATAEGLLTFDLVPSVVALTDQGEMVGTGAHRERAKTASNLVKNKSIWWDTKNEIGTRRQYPGAPEGYRTPAEIAERILRFLHTEAVEADERPIDRVVVTVPASFQLTQRQDTLVAAAGAGLDMKAGDLLDEPVAAFLDFLTQSGDLLLGKDGTSRVMVVDFGGGTCDVALLQIKRSAVGGVELSRKGVSRFHRIGGSDIDLAIAHEVLLPQLMEQNGMKAMDIDFRRKRDQLLPPLAAAAEQLKKSLSDRIAQLQALNQFDENDPQLASSLPTAIEVNTKHPDFGVVKLTKPTLTLQELRKAIAPFLDPFALEPVGNEYFQASSIFSPIRDSLARAQWTPQHVDQVLLVGGSSLFFAVKQSLSQYFSTAALHMYSFPLDAQRCVGRGAAWQALLLAVYGESPLRPTIADGVSIRTANGPLEIIPNNSVLPFPAQVDWEEIHGLAIPQSSDSEPLELVVSFNSGERELQSTKVRVLPPYSEGDAITIKVRVDENQRFVSRVVVTTTAEEQEFAIELDNPFSVTANPNADRDEVLRIEEEILNAPASSQLALMKQLAELLRQLGEYERAKQLFMLLVGRAESDNERGRLYFTLARLSGDLLDTDGVVAFYLKAIAKGYTNPSRFNLTLAYCAAGNAAAALSVVDAEIAEGGGEEDHLLRAKVLKDLDRHDEASAAFKAGFKDLQPLDDTSDWQLAWLNSAAHTFGSEDDRASLSEEKLARAARGAIIAKASVVEVLPKMGA